MTIYSAADHPLPSLDGGMVVVGAGAVGITTAIALARAGHSVVILEGGPRQPRADYHKENEGPVTARHFPTLISHRMRALGGTTLLWGGQLVPFDPSDFENRDRDGNRLWPIDHEDMAPWFDAAYDLLGVSAQGRDTEGIWQRATGREPGLGPNLAVRMNIWLKQPDFTRLFGEELANHPGITVITDCAVTALRFADRSSAASLDVTLPDGTVRSFSPAQIVLANGTIEIVRLLLRAAATQPACPLAGNPHLGRWFIDHFHIVFAEVKAPDVSAISQLFDNIYFDGRKYSVKIRSTVPRLPGRPNMVGTLNAGMSVGQMAAETRELLARLFRGEGGVVAAFRRGLALGRIIVPIAWRYLRHRRSTNLFDRGIKFGAEVEQMPLADSYLLLDPESPPEMARAGVHYTIDPAMLDDIAQFGAQVRAAFAEQGLGEIVLDPRVEARDASFLDAISGAGHHMGGARMAAGRDRGVVDRDLKVFGTSNLYLAGAVVFPTGSFANSTFTAIALGQRLANHLAGSAEAHPANETITSRLVFGCSRLAGGASTRTSARLLKAALARGVSAIDVAPSYGMGLAEKVVGKVLRSRPSRGTTVIAKLGSHRDPRGLAKSWLREARRRLYDRGPRSHAAFTPAEAKPRYGTSDFSAEGLRRSFAIARRRLGRIDMLLLHSCGRDEYTPEVAAVLDELAQSIGARIGYANGPMFDLVTDVAFPPDMVAECAIDPRWLTGEASPPRGKTLILHSIVPTGDWLERTDPAFATLLAKAAELVPAADPATAKMAALYAIAAVRVPEARLVFASSHPPRLNALLDAFAAIDSGALLPRIATLLAPAETTGSRLPLPAD